MQLTPEDVNLADVALALRREFQADAPGGYLEGRTVLRDMVAGELDCSVLEAEQIVDTMVSRGFLRFVGDPIAAPEPGIWLIDPAAS